jgi:alginate O-acetyltransferase complex protein AlgI
MSFVSFEFIILFILTFILLVIIKSPTGKKLILLVASCVFYAAWDWRFLGLLALITIVIYLLTQSMVNSNEKRSRKLKLIVNIVFSLCVLFFFKYFNFLIDNVNSVLTLFGWKISSLNIILMLGISFFTFGNLSYVIDIYRGLTTPAKSFLDFAVFVTFFPRLISGPIVRANQFIPQLERGIEINFPNFMIGLQKFIQGLIKKLVVADSLSLFVDQIYNQPASFSSATVWLCVLAYSVQVYFDFSGYIDMAIGVSKILGFDLPANFDFPFTAQSVTEFWRRWNISLSNWFRDYVFIRLEFKRRRVKHFRIQTDLMITFLLVGLWHGANWNFVFWGGLHGMFLIVEHWITKGRHIPTIWKSSRSWLRAFVTYMLVTIAMVFFRSPGIAITQLVLSKLLFLSPTGINWFYQSAVIFVPLVILGGWIYRSVEGKFHLPTLSYPVQFSLMALEVLFIYFFASLNISPFIYFQF